MRAAAVASVYGFDPLAYLALEADDARIANQIIAQRAQLDDQRERGRLDYLASKTASLTVQALTKWLGKNLPRVLGKR